MTYNPAVTAISTVAVRLARAYPSLSTYSCVELACSLCAIERAQRRHAERCCSGEDGGYVRKRDFAKLDVFDGKAPRGTTTWRKDPDTGRWLVEHDPVAEERAGKRIELQREKWTGKLMDLLRGDRSGQCFINVFLLDDPRGCVLKIQFPGEKEPIGV